MRLIPSILGIFVCCSSLGYSALTLSSINSDDSLKDSRSLYKTAVRQLKGREYTRYYQSKSELLDYPLKSYLDYYEVKAKLRKLPYKRVDNFLEENQGSYLATRLQSQWLTTLAKQRRWGDYLKYWDPSIANTSRSCYHLQALYNTGKKQQALQETTALWLSGASQPSACDPLFKNWLASDHSNPQLIWQRLDLAVNKRNISLARYVRQQLPPAQQDTARLYINLHRHPERLNQQKLAHLEQEHKTQIAAHTLKRLAYRKPQLAKSLFEQHRKEWQLNDDEQAAIIRAVAIGLKKQDPQQAIAWILQMDPNGSDEKLLEQRIRLALSLNEWQSVYQWILLLPQEQQVSNRWLYWRARAQQRIGMQPIQKDWQSDALMKHVASSRDYYGFLAADYLGISYQMQDSAITVSPEMLSSVEANHGIQRALELYAINELTAARREWWYSSRSLTADQLVAAAKLAENLNWYPTAIHSMIKAKQWNDLTTRFPLAYEDKIITTATQENIETNWLYAIARQESAFTHDAKSSAGALGVLQLMPATARQTAKSLGIRYKQYDLLTPKKNIQIGGNYLASLFKQFDGNRVLATAAYNAGPNRVRQWLRNSKQPLEQDVWTEIIPYKETRHYVQNVMAFSVIYGYRRNDHHQLLRNNESIIALN